MSYLQFKEGKDLPTLPILLGVALELSNKELVMD